LIANGKINLDDVQNDIEAMKDKEYLENHPYEVWEGNDGYWRTYLPDEEKGRKLKKLKTEAKINKVIIDYYKQKSNHSDRISFKEAYKRWFDVYSIRFSTTNTHDKYRSDYKRFFKGRDFEIMPLSEMNEENISAFIIKLIKELKLSPKACKTLCGYIRNTLKSAKINKLIKENPFENIETKSFYPFCKKIVKTAEERTVSQDQYRLLFQRFAKDYQDHPDYIPTYAVHFASLTGLRVSEIAALRWADIQNGIIEISHSEKYIRETKECFIGETKNEKKRFMPLTDETKALLIKVREIEKEYGYLGEFIFQNEEGRVRASVISSCAKNKCLQLGIPVKSIHAYRRTFSSKLKCNGVSSTVVSALLGHTEEVNEQYYTYDITNIEEKKLMVGMVTKEITMSQFVGANNTIESSILTEK